MGLLVVGVFVLRFDVRRRRDRWDSGDTCMLCGHDAVVFFTKSSCQSNELSAGTNDKEVVCDMWATDRKSTRLNSSHWE